MEDEFGRMSLAALSTKETPTLLAVTPLPPVSLAPPLPLLLAAVSGGRRGPVFKPPKYTSSGPRSREEVVAPPPSAISGPFM